MVKRSMSVNSKIYKEIYLCVTVTLDRHLDLQEESLWILERRHATRSEGWQGMDYRFHHLYVQTDADAIPVT